MNESTAAKFSTLVEVIEKLRRECPWDRQQTAESLRQYILEETYEVLQTIDQADRDKLKGELGDLLLQIILQSVIAAEQKHFTLEQVIEAITAKMIERHPHVFANLPVNGVKDIIHNWEQIKRNKEKRSSLLADIPLNLPALLRAQRIQEKAATVNFDWPDLSGVLEKVEEEIREFKQALLKEDRANMQEELGDIIFSLVNLSRFLGLTAEDALRLTNEKFIRRFHFIEEYFQQDYEKMKQANLAELDLIWNKSKE
jgi:tetrapyrrole methylase family protein/MazG family protein